MQKIKNNIKENAAIYLVIFLTLVIFFIITFVNKNNQEVEPIDTVMFNVVTTKDVDKLFESKEAKMIVVGSKECSATKAFVPHMQISIGLAHYTLNYLELTNENIESNEYKKFVSRLDYLYTLDNEEKELKEYMGMTPMILIVKNNKVIYGSIGKVDEDALIQLVDRYGVSYEKN